MIYLYNKEIYLPKTREICKLKCFRAQIVKNYPSYIEYFFLTLLLNVDLTFQMKGLNLIYFHILCKLKRTKLNLFF